MEKSIFELLKEWRIERDMEDKPFVLSVEVSNMLKEVTEYLDGIDDVNERVDALCDIMVFRINATHMRNVPFGCENLLELGRCFEGRSIYHIIDCISSISHSDNDFTIEFCSSMIVEEGYNPDLCMREVIKEVSSRKQDPAQAANWKHYGVSGKWEKDRKQDPSTLYKADFSKCKL
jgi:hypothetical protein